MFLIHHTSFCKLASLALWDSGVSPHGFFCFGGALPVPIELAPCGAVVSVLGQFARPLGEPMYLDQTRHGNDRQNSDNGTKER